MGSDSHYSENDQNATHRGQMRTPAEAIFDLLGAFQALTRSILDSRIEISEPAWKVIGYMFMLSSIYFLGEPIFTSYFWLVLGILFILLILEITIRNWNRINQRFNGTRTFDELVVAGFDEETIIKWLESFSFKGSDLEKIVGKLKEDGIWSVKINDTIVRTQNIPTPLIFRYLSETIPSSTLLSLISSNPNKFPREKVDFIFSNWAEDEEIVRACLISQFTAADVLYQKKIFDFLPADLSMLRKLCANYPNSIWKPLVIISTLLLTLVFTSLLFNTTIHSIESSCTAATSSSCSSSSVAGIEVYVISVTVIVGLLTYIILSRLAESGYYSFLNWKCRGLLKKVKNRKK